MIKVNLLPEELRKRPPGGFNYFYLFAIPVIVTLTLVPIYISKVQELKKITEEVEKIEIEMKKYEGIKGDLDKTNSDINLIKSKISFIQSKRREQAFWNKALDRITATLPQNIWLDSLNLSPDGNVSIVGNTFSFQDIAEFIKILQRSPNFSNVKLYSTFKTGGDMLGTERVTFSMSMNYREVEGGK